MSNHFLQMYFGLGAFTGLEPQSTENKTIVVNKKRELLYQAYLESSHDVEREKDLIDWDGNVGSNSGCRLPKAGEKDWETSLCRNRGIRQSLKTCS